MTEVITPSSVAEVRNTIHWALSRGAALEVRGRGTKARLGRPMEKTAAVLDLSALSGVTFYEPEELVISLKPGTMRREVEALLAQRGQTLAFEPPDWGPLLGHPPDTDTMGGVIGVNAAGPRRLKAGAARDYVLGVKGVSGFGEEFKSGGRVMKNVSGYDLSKLVTGSFGTLAALTEITLKVLPRPETELTLVLTGLDLPTGLKTLRRAASHPSEGSAFAFLPASVSMFCPAETVARAGGSATLIRLEGPAPSIGARAQALLASLAAHESYRLGPEESRAAWRAIRDVAPLAPPANLPLWRVSVPPTDADAVLLRDPAPWSYLDWAGGLIWIASASPPVIDRGAAMLVRASDDVRARLPFLTAPDDALATLMHRVKASFDPQGVLNPGRMYEGV
jgi:glycolate oxidase FAD binding subunit